MTHQYFRKKIFLKRNVHMWYVKKCVKLTAYLFIFCLCGCSTKWFTTFDHGYGIAIYEMPNFKRTAFISPPKGYYSREKVVHVDDKNHIVKTIAYSDKKMMIREFDFNGKLINANEISYKNENTEYVEYYLRKYRYYYRPSGSCASDDGRFIIYVAYDNWDKKNYFYLLDLNSQKTIILNEGYAKPFGTYIMKVDWLSDSKICLWLYNYMSDKKHALIFDRYTKTYADLKDRMLRLDDVNLSTQKNYFTYSLMVGRADKEERLYVMDSLSFTIKKELSIMIEPENRDRGAIPGGVRCFSWNHDETKLAYIKDGNKIVLLSLDNATPHIIHEFKNSSTSGISYIGFLNDDVIYYVYQCNLLSTNFFLSYDYWGMVNINTGEITDRWRCPSIDQGGEIYPVDGGKKIICEMGPVYIN